MESGREAAHGDVVSLLAAKDAEGIRTCSILGADYSGLPDSKLPNKPPAEQLPRQ